MGDLHTRHIALVEAVNAAESEVDHRIAEARLRGFREAAGALGRDYGMHIAADLHYIDQGIDRPMCAGVFLDWQPRKVTP